MRWRDMTPLQSVKFKILPPFDLDLFRHVRNITFWSLKTRFNHPMWQRLMSRRAHSFDYVIMEKKWKIDQDKQTGKIEKAFIFIRVCHQYFKGPGR